MTPWNCTAGAVGGNPAWVFCDKDHLPSVGDTYIVLNPFTAKQYGHVGIVLHVPPNGHGLWVMADGGQGGRPDQLAILVPRWGLMASELPAGGRPKGIYPDMTPEPDGGPFLSGATQGDLDLKAPNPKDDEDGAGIINRIQFRPTKPDHLTSCPRRLEGYVDVVHPVLKFTNVDGKPSTADVMTKCGELKTKVQNVIASFRGGAFVGGTGT